MIKKIGSFLLVIFFAFANIANAEDQVDDLFKPKYLSDFVYGNENAPITVLEYYSLSCPHCSYFYASIFPSLKKEYIDTGKVKWIKRSYAIDYASIKGTMLIECVDKDRRESYLRILLSKQSNWAYQKNFIHILSNIASLGGMNIDRFNNCMNNKSNEKLISEASSNSRELLKLSGTPTFFVNKEHVKVYSENAFKEVFDKLLAKK
jgi:protein-disulfide isomerase